MILRAGDPGRNKALLKDVREVFGKKFRFDPKDEDAIFVWNTMEMASLDRRHQPGIQSLHGHGGIFTLSVGGIGVANIMNVVVEEKNQGNRTEAGPGGQEEIRPGQFLFETLAHHPDRRRLRYGRRLRILSAFPRTSIEEEIGDRRFPRSGPDHRGPSRTDRVHFRVRPARRGRRGSSPMEAAEVLRKSHESGPVGQALLPGSFETRKKR